MKQILIGTSGYDYPDWKGVFYPQYVKRIDFLSYYATRFNALELNSTFYSMPTADRLFSFYERSEGRVSSSIKAINLLTHHVSAVWQNVADDFKAALMPLFKRNVLSAVLFQFPQSFRYTVENRLFLANLIASFEGFPVVIEFRHKEWIRKSVFEGIDLRNASVVFCDMPRLASLPAATFQYSHHSPFIGQNAYVRLHGRNAAAWYSCSPETNGCARYDYEYSLQELKSFVPVIHAAQSEGRSVQMYFNNHPKGNGAKNALQLKEFLKENLKN